MGVAGAAWATVIGQIISGIWVVGFLCSKRSAIRIRKRNLLPRLNVLWDIVTLGISNFITTGAESIVNIVLNHSLKKYGALALTGFSVDGATLAITVGTIVTATSSFIRQPISCCAGLVVTAFGVRDSMIDIASLQFESVQTYDMEAAFADGAEERVCEKLDEIDGIDRYLTASVHRVDLQGANKMNGVNLYSFSDTDSLPMFWDFHTGDAGVPFPGKNEAIVNSKVAEKLELAIGDTFEMKDADMRVLTVTVSGIFDNYVDNFVIISSDTFAEAFDSWKANTVLLSISQDNQETAARLTETDEITSVTSLSATKERVDSALSCLNDIIWLIVLFSGALAFIVIFNLTNINLAERSREIATVEVLGFYPKETESYVLRENLILSVLASFIGLPLGTLFHRIVMSMIVIDTMNFDIHVTAVSYILAVVCTVLFAVMINQVMKRQLSKIPMAESLKAVE